MAARAGARRTVPFDLAALDRIGQRGGLAWPLHMPSLARPMRRATAALLRAALALDDPAWRDAGLLMLPPFANRARAVIAAALALGAADAMGIDLVGGPPEVDGLRDGGLGLGDGDELALPGDRNVPPRWRAVARAASWTPMARLPRALLAPEAVAVTHNSLLAQCARRGPAAVGFIHATRLLGAGRARAPARAPDLGNEAKALADALLTPFAIPHPYGERARALVVALAARGLAGAWADMAGLAALPRLPRAVWSGTGGNHAARAIGLAVMARGGRVTRFAHGGSLGPVDMIEQAAVTEFAVSDRFVGPSEGVRRLLDRPELHAMLAPARRVDLAAAGAGEPTPRLAPRPRTARPTVLYVSTAALGFTGHAPPFLPDVVYLDWQMRLARALGGLPASAVARPHPEGLLRGRRHPLADVIALAEQPFEAVMGEADVFVFDYPCSTTFWTALRTDRPVVYLDLGIVPFAAAVEPELRRRCAVVPVAYDADNLPIVPAEALAEAIARAAPVDAGPWRALLDGGGP